MNTLKKKQSQLEEVLVFPKNLFWSQKPQNHGDWNFCLQKQTIFGLDIDGKVNILQFARAYLVGG